MSRRLRGLRHLSLGLYHGSLLSANAIVPLLNFVSGSSSLRLLFQTELLLPLQKAQEPALSAAEGTGHPIF